MSPQIQSWVQSSPDTPGALSIHHLIVPPTPAIVKFDRKWCHLPLFPCFLLFDPIFSPEPLPGVSCICIKTRNRAHVLAPGALTCSPVIWQNISKELLRIYCSCWLIPTCLTPFMSLACVLVSQIHPHGIHPLSNLARGIKSSLVIARSLFCINISPPLQKHVG